ncbi:MAG: WD40 repeat domain-containing protein [Acidobacteria bacterium]|nr:WD40 repeat domain-containing protein [Acidobacteriota bacterium]
MVDDFVKAIRQSGAETITTRLAAKLGDASSNLLLLVDQFEEIFRFGVESNKPDQREEAEDFVSLMLALADQRELPIYVVMTMRSDFIGDCDNFYGLPEAMNRSQYLVPRLTRQQRQQAIEGPIRLFGANITPRLLDRVLNDVGDKSDQLPVMQHALLRTWEQWQKERQSDGETEGLGDGANPQSTIRNPQSKNSQSVDVRHYEAVGTLTEALSRDAEAALESLSEDDQKIAERMFQALTDTDARNRQIRRPAHLSELCAITGTDRDTIETIIEEFSGSGRSFLTATNEADPLIDISHESLIRQWRQASEWVKAETEWRDRYKRLSHDAEIHRQSGKNEDLLKGTQLISALEWEEKRNPNHTWSRRYHSTQQAVESDRLFNLATAYLIESDKTSRREIMEVLKRRKRSQRIAWSIALVISLLLLSLLGFGWFAIEQDSKYRKEIYESDIKTAKEEFEQQHYSRTMDLLTRYLPVQLIFFQEDLRDERWYRLWQQMHDEVTSLIGHSDEVVSVVFAPDGKTLASASFDKTIKLWDIKSRQNFLTLKGHEAQVLSVAFAPNGRLLASGSSDATIKLWDTKTWQNFATLKGHESVVRSVAFSPDSQILASTSYDHTIRIWNTYSGQLLNTLKGHEAPVWSVAFAPDGKTLASAGWDNVIKLWDTHSGQLQNTLRGHESSVYSVAFSPDGKTIASAGGFEFKLWHTPNGKLLRTFEVRYILTALAFAPNGKTIATASNDKTIKLLDGRTGRNIVTLKGHESAVNSVAFSPDGKTLASASADNTVKLWDTASLQNIATLKGHEDSVRSVSFASDGKTLASAGGVSDGKKDFAIRLWRAATDADVARQRNR